MAVQVAQEPQHLEVEVSQAVSTVALASWVRLAEPLLLSVLADEPALETVCAVARRLPGCALGVLEFRLASGEHPVDLSLQFLDPASALEVSGRVEPEGLRSFLRSWAEGALGTKRVSGMWLELDLEGRPPAELAPSVCAKLRGPLDPDWLEEILLPGLQGETLSPAQRHTVRACLGAIPAPAHLLYAFCMLPRPGWPLRLEIFGLDPEGMIEYLGRVAPFVLTHVSEQVRLFEGIERTHLSLDLIGGEISPRIGIEGSYARQPKREPRWRELFERLVKAGMCSSAKGEAALAWPGWESFWTAPERWPAAGAGGYCVRYLSHVKVVCRPDREPEAKVYLALGGLRERSGELRASRERLHSEARDCALSAKRATRSSLKVR